MKRLFHSVQIGRLCRPSSCSAYPQERSELQESKHELRNRRGRNVPSGHPLRRFERIQAHTGQCRPFGQYMTIHTVVNRNHGSSILRRGSSPESSVPAIAALLTIALFLVANRRQSSLLAQSIGLIKYHRQFAGGKPCHMAIAETDIAALSTVDSRLLIYQHIL